MAPCVTSWACQDDSSERGKPKPGIDGRDATRRCYLHPVKPGQPIRIRAVDNKKKPFPHACMYAWMDGWMDVPRDTLSQPSPAAQPAGEDGYGDRHGMGYEMDMGLGLRALAPIPLGG